MVDTAVFGIFHRHRPDTMSPDLFPVAENQVAQEPDSPVLPLTEMSVQTLVEPQRIMVPVTEDDLSPEHPRIEWLDVPVAYAFVSLADPAICTVMASFSPAGPFEITADSTGLYRSASFRPAPWSGFAYDVAPDRRTGLVAGTRILTARGEVAVEDLLPGDTAMALRGPALLPILWIGRCIADEPPVLIEAGALGDQRPSRSLYVAADHPIFVDPVPVPARRLINGTTIHQTTGPAELFHVDVGRHDVLFAQNLALASTQRPVSEPPQ